MKKFSWIVFAALIFAACQNREYDLVIRNVLIIDGTGDHTVVASVAISADTIAAIGELKDLQAKTSIDATGLALAPGFIDTHSHHDGGLFEHRGMEAVVSQGVTTIVVGQDGFSHFPLSDFYSKLESSPVAVNLASYTGHNTLRDSVMGEDYRRMASDNEVKRMEDMITLDMENGSLGLSTGLEYDPGIYSDPSEVMRLARVAATDGGRYISHIRSEDRHVWKAIREVIAIGSTTGMPVQISHAKLAMKSWWGHADQWVNLMDSARAAGLKISADVYPYPYWQSTMKVLFPDRDFASRQSAEFALTELTTPEGLLINNFSLEPSYEGKTLAEVSVLRKTDPAQTLMDLIAWVDREHGDESIIATSMDAKDINTIMKWRDTNICSDGSSTGLHPRGYGSFPRVIRKYVIEDKVLTLEEAIYKMSGLSAKHMGMKRRGQIKKGYYADLVLFDPVAIADEATTVEPQKMAKGIIQVWVNGTSVFAESKTTGAYPGRILYRSN